jgi:drug/metabolite transporter (DMT)-like permease
MVKTLYLGEKWLDKGRLAVLIEASFVTFLWSSSYILVKIGLTQLSPLTLASLRYTVASTILITLAFSKGEATLIKTKKTFIELAFLGFCGYSLAQGLQCIGLYYLPAVSVTFILNFTPIIVLILGVIFLQEYPSWLQMVGMIIVMIGALFFFNDPLMNSSLAGVLITLLSSLGWAAYLVLSRIFFTRGKIKPLALTAFPMGFGTLLMALATFYFEGFQAVSLLGWHHYLVECCQYCTSFLYVE